ncbi:CBS domain-containing protein [Lipingzhangella halophila]|uniref:CBS domain-containing protein n=1 Tax=Lipingzhangella halophila TaxID=1783352 RepID=A0A7W7W1U0_9ACTN|nr:CBS domain-containing protein [Lipingzhangella halophila]MBB4930104.1 CBS domain-containing protein [Lipingzhangella halophila]
MTTASEIMHEGAECVDETETVNAAARKMRDLGVGALPICGTDRRLKGILTDRDIVIKCLAEDMNPANCNASEMASGKPFYVDADADIDTVLQQMMEHRVKRMPVIRDRQLVGMISEADLAKNLPEQKVTQFVESIKSGPPDRVS